MRYTTHRFVQAVLAVVVALSGACAGKSRGSVDAQAGESAAASCVRESATYAPGERFFEKADGCARRCSCLPSGEVECLAWMCEVDSGPTRSDPQDGLPDDDGCNVAAQPCLWSGGVLAVGESGVDGCSTYSCGAGGTLTCAVGACGVADAGVPTSCSLPTSVDFGLDGGFGVDDTSNILDPSGTLTVGHGARACVSALPACGTPCAITVATIAKDLADPEVQTAFASLPGTLFGARLGFGDVANLRITLGDGRSILVGYPCCRRSDIPCQPIPQGLQRLADDLQALLEANACYR